MENKLDIADFSESSQLELKTFMYLVQKLGPVPGSVLTVDSATLKATFEFDPTKLPGW